SNALDLDLGVMYDARVFRLGAVARNLLQPSFNVPAGSATPDPISLKRTARMGLAVMPGGGLTLAMDVDLVTVDLLEGPRRMMACGGEERLGTKVAARGGLGWNLAGGMGERHPVATAGASLAVRPQLWLDVNVTRGSVFGDRGFGGALRIGR